MKCIEREEVPVYLLLFLVCTFAAFVGASVALWWLR